MTWGAPAWFALLAVVALVAVVMAWAARDHVRRLGRLFGPTLVARVLPRRVRARRRLRDLAGLAGLVCLVIALAEPRFGKRLVEVEAEGVDLVLVVDLSRSMDARDVDPSRLERARREILDLTSRFAGDRVGLVLYAGGAYPRMPLTLDYGALELMVRDLDTHLFQTQGSALGEGIRTALTLLERQTGEAGQGIVVITDGEVHDPDDAYAAAGEAADAGVPVFGLLVGSEPSPIPEGNHGFVRDRRTGEQVVTTPDASVLTEIARRTGGAVVQSVASDADVDRLYRGEIRPSLEAAIGRTTQRETHQAAFHWPLGAGLVLLLLSGWLGDGRRAVRLAAILLFLPALAQAQTVRDGDLAYRDGRYTEAVDIFTDLVLQQPDDADLQGRLGAARYRAGDLNGAARAFERQAQLSNDADARYNAGNAYWRAGRLEDAMARYEEVLAADPEHPGASRNLPLLQEELQQRELQQQMQQQQQQQQQQASDGQTGDQQQQMDGTPSSNPSPQQGGQPQDPSEEQPQGDPQGSPDDQAQQQQQPEGQPEGGQQQQQPSASSDSQQQASGDAGERKDAPEDGDGHAALDEIQPNEEGEDAATEAGGGAAGAQQPTDGEDGMPAAQAERILEGVEEGKPRVYVPGKGTEKPW